MSSVRLTAIGLALALAACGDASTGPVEPTPTVATILLTSPTATLVVGATVSLTAVARDAQGREMPGQAFVWQSSDVSIATVAGGVVSGVAEGPVTIRASVGAVTSNAVSITVTPGVPATNESSLALIDSALARGAIDAETALRYKVFATYGDARLPGAYRGNNSEVFESTVPFDLDAAFDTLSEATQTALVPFLLRPANRGSWLNPGSAAAAEAGAGAGGPQGAVLRPVCNGDDPFWASIVTPTAKVRVWYDTRRSDASQAQEVATFMESTVWPRLITGLGFKEPLDDASSVFCDGGDGRLDMYIVAGLGARGFTRNRPLTRRQSATHIELQAGERGVALRQTVTHEFMHAIQWAYEMEAGQYDYGWLRDAMANWAVDVTDPGNARLLRNSKCYMTTPHMRLEDRSQVPCGGFTLERDYGAYLFFQFIGRTKGNATVKNILAATENEDTGVKAINAVLGGIETVWGDFARTLWNKEPVTNEPAAFKNWDMNGEVPELALDYPQVTSADLAGRPESEEAIDVTVNNLSSKYYHFTFTDELNRSLMFHNTFYDVWRQGRKVKVQALLKPEGGGAWFEEDWTEYEWIGLCRDFKQQRVSDVVIIVSSAEWQGTSPRVVASRKPRLMSNNIGCYGYEGRTTRTYRHTEWGSGVVTVQMDVRFDYLPGTTPLQYTNRQQGRLRVPILAPQLTGGQVEFREQYVESGCSYSAGGTYTESGFPQGNLLGNMTINYFNESLPPDLRSAQEELVGTAKRAYVAYGVNTRKVKGSVTGPQPDCGTEYETSPAGWLLTEYEGATRSTVAINGFLIGSFRTDDGPIREEYTWNLRPMREP